MHLRGYLLLSDGTRLEGRLKGARDLVAGEIVFNTSHTGYQEILTDPSYHGQIVVLTCPEIGNYGCHPEASESARGLASGMVIRQSSPGTWHRSFRQDFDAFLAEKGVTAIEGLDTRFLTRHIRDGGNQNALIAPASVPRAEAEALLRATPAMTGANLVPHVSADSPRTHGHGTTRVALLDFGIKTATIRALVARDCRVTQLPWNTPFDAIADLDPHGVLLSNGPGDPAAVPGVGATVTALMEAYPVMGICLGFQLMGLALGGQTYKLPFGHRGGNHPVRTADRVVITSQNHGFAVRAESLNPQRVELTHESLFDGSLEGFRLRQRPVFGVQFHPEASPGPHDCLDHFDHFLSLSRRHHA